MLMQSIDQVLGTIDCDAHRDAAIWLSQFSGSLTDATIAAAANYYADYRFEHWSDAQTPALRDIYEWVFRIVACPLGSWPWPGSRAGEELCNANL